MIADELGLPWVSTGEFLRMLVTGERRREMLAGKLLADSEIIAMADRIFHMIDTKQEFILDGFPRTAAQAEWLLAQHKAKLLHITRVINLEAAQEVVAKRLLNRGRQDDTREALNKRFTEYKAVTLPIISKLESSGIPVSHVNADQTPHDVHDVIVPLLK
jgi:adenylate kinase